MLSTRCSLAVALFLLSVGCSSPEPVNPLAGPGSVPASAEGPAPSTSPAPGGPTDAGAPPAGAADPVSADDLCASGPELEGVVLAGDERDALAGVSVVEYGVEGAEPAVSGADGAFALTLTNEATPTVLVTHAGYVSTIQICAANAPLRQRGEFTIEVFDAAEERAAASELGAPWDDSKAHVIVSVAIEDPNGVQVTLDAEGAKAWTFSLDDTPAPGSTLSSATAKEVVFNGVPPGTWPLSVNAPDGVVCKAPEKVPAVANSYTQVLVGCEALTAGTEGAPAEGAGDQPDSVPPPEGSEPGDGPPAGSAAPVPGGGGEGDGGPAGDAPEGGATDPR